MTVEDENSSRAPVRVLHPMLLALYPVLGLFASNTDKTDVTAVIRPSLLLAGAALMGWLILWAALRNRYKAGLAASVIVVGSLTGWSLLEFLIKTCAPFLDGSPPWLLYGAYLVGVTAGLVGLVYWRRSRPHMIGTVIPLAATAAGLLALRAAVLAPAFGAGAGWLIALYIVAMAFALAVLALHGGDYRRTTQTLNWFAGVLIVLSVLNVVLHLPSKKPTPSVAKPTTADSKQQEAASVQYPDIYFIALDGYARADVLRRNYAWDNGGFLDTLRAKGFAVAERSRSNYALSLFSLTSCLNMGFLQDLLPARGADSEKFGQVLELYHENKVFSYLRDRGYSLQVLAPGSTLLEPRDDVDVRLQPLRTMTEFERVLAKSTVASRAVQLAHYLRGETAATLREDFIRTRVEFAFDRLGKLSGEKSVKPRLVFAYLPVPEPPFVFDAKGESVAAPAGASGDDTSPNGAAADYKQGYVEQLQYVNRRLAQTVDLILKQSVRPAVILIASSNGAWLEMPGTPTETAAVVERFSNVILARFPEGTPASAPAPVLPDQLSLVNLFPFAFNHLFHAGLALHEDKAFVSTSAHPMEFSAFPLSE